MELTHLHILCLFNNKPIVKFQTPSAARREIYQGKALPRLGFGISSSLEVYPIPPLNKHNNWWWLKLESCTVNFFFNIELRRTSTWYIERKMFAGSVLTPMIPILHWLENHSCYSLGHVMSLWSFDLWIMCTQSYPNDHSYKLMTQLRQQADLGSGHFWLTKQEHHWSEGQSPHCEIEPVTT